MQAILDALKAANAAVVKVTEAEAVVAAAKKEFDQTLVVLYDAMKAADKGTSEVGV